MMLMILGHHIGLVTPQTGTRPEIGEVMDTGEGKKLFYYHRGGPLPMHMDPVDVVGLLCVRKAKRGGESGISSAMVVHNEILKTRPDLLEILYRGYRHHRRHAAGDAEKKLLTDHYCPIFYKLEEETVCSMIPHVIEGAVEEGLLEFTPVEAEALEYFKATAARSDIRLHMDLEPGDLQLLNNRAILHNRLDYEDYPEPERRRLMLRLWLTMPEWGKLPPTIPHKDAELQTSPA
jgi:Taurine catabolism dioxygenase TauD, TfdA family